MSHRIRPLFKARLLLEEQSPNTLIRSHDIGLDGSHRVLLRCIMTSRTVRAVYKLPCYARSVP
eukprot:145541-Hanusia_phi.AAC.1